MKLFRSLKKQELLLFLACVFSGGALYLFRIESLMPFVGDQGWYYLSAYRLIRAEEFPLVGIASSHPWIHQGAFWTYLIAPFLYLTHLHPLSGFFVSFVFGVATIIALFMVCCKLFDKRVALIALVLYVFSPMIVMQVRMPYHVSPIPFFTIIYIYSLYLITKKRALSLPLALCLLAILYNFELASFLLVIPLVGILGFGFIMREKWIKPILNLRVLIYSTVGLIIPLIPFLIYDLSHGFSQTFKFIAWIGYKILIVFRILPESEKTAPFILSNYLNSEAEHLKNLIFMPNLFLAVSIFIISGIYFSYLMYKNKLYKKSPFLIVYLWFVGGIVSYIVQKISSDAYLPIFVSSILLVVALCLNKVKNKYLLGCVLVMYAFFNTLFLIKDNFLMGRPGGYGVTLRTREDAVKSILSSTRGKSYTIIGSGPGSQFSSFTMNYQFLSIYLGHPSSFKGKRFYISESYDKVMVLEEKK